MKYPDGITSAIIKSLEEINQELIEVCKKAKDLLEDEWAGTSPNSLGNKVIKQIEQAIARAEGKE